MTLELQQWCPDSHLILARAAARLSLFWNRARINCLTSLAVNSSASGPLPSAQRSAMSTSLASSNIWSSCRRFHLATCFMAEARATPASPASSRVKNSGALSRMTVIREQSPWVSVDWMSSRATMEVPTSTRIQFTRVPAMQASIVNRQISNIKIAKF